MYLVRGCVGISHPRASELLSVDADPCYHPEICGLAGCVLSHFPFVGPLGGASGPSVFIVLGSIIGASLNYDVAWRTGQVRQTSTSDPC